MPGTPKKPSPKRNSPKRNSPKKPSPKRNSPKSAKNKPHLTSNELNKYNRQVMQGRINRGASYKSYPYGGSRKRRSR